MILAPGTKLGRYEIRSKIGAGGMGEVYLAQDAELDRPVALKFLPPEVAADQKRLTRFFQEAKAASALNHPNILTVYEIGRTDDTNFFATEFVDGVTLRERMHAPAKLSEVLDIATQIASALVAAHTAGIVHRDIKPENVMIRKDGYVKVLDFGLAKLTERQTSDIDKEAATIALVQTEPGVVMGTVAYMSPEQARGLAVDARTDIWSLGVVIYEMLAGRLPFFGSTTSDALVAILDREPAPLSIGALPPPAEFQRIVTKALRKDSEERYQTIKDLLLDLRSLKQEVEHSARLARSADSAEQRSATTIGEAGQAGLLSARTQIVSTGGEGLSGDNRTESMALKSPRSRKTILFVVLAAVLMMGIGLAIFMGAPMAIYNRFRSRGTSSAFQKTEITQLTTSRNLAQVAISPDGKYIAYATSDDENQSLWLRQANASNDLQIIAPALVSYEGITFTADAGTLYYVTREANGASTLYRVPVLGGTPQKLISNVDSPVTFSPDGKRLAFVRGKYPSADQSALLVADANSGEEKVLATRRSPQFFYPIGNWTGPSWSPDGELIACAVADLSNGRQGNVFTFAIKDGSEKRIMRRDFTEIGRVEWLADMSGLVMVGTEQFTGSFPGQVWYLSYPDGETRRITNDLGNYRALSMTAEGSKLVTVAFNDLYGIWTAPEGDAARARQIIPGDKRATVSWTPDGRTVYVTAMGGHRDIWIMNSDGSNRKQLTSNAEQNFEPSVSPDGRYIAFYSTRAGRGDLWRIDIDGGNPRQLTHGLLTWQPSWSPDGQWIFFLTYPDWKIWKAPLEGGSPVAVTDHRSYRPVISPDGKQMACFYSDSRAEGSFESVYHLAILPVEGGPPLRTFPFRGGDDPTFSLLQWTPDGRAILYNATTHNVSNIWSQPVDGGTPKQVTNFKDASINSFAWSRDGHWLACSRGTITSDAVLITQIK